MTSIDGRPLRIGLEVGWDPTWPAGLQYVRNLVYALDAVEPPRRPSLRLLPVDAASAARVRDLAELDLVMLAAPKLPERVLEALLLTRRAVRRWVQPVTGHSLDPAFAGLDVTYPGFGTPIPGTPQMQWIPDLQHVHLPHLFTTEEIARRDERFAAIASHRGVVILSSAAAKRDFEQHYPEAIATPRVWRFTTTLTEREFGDLDPRHEFSLPDTFLYVANQFWKHKDHLTLFRALAKLKEIPVTPTVVCTGMMEEPRDPEYVPLLLRFLDENDLHEQVRLLNFVDRDVQIAIFRHAAAVLQPSTFEGWSTVIEDAKAIGRPVIASDIAVHREQAPEAMFFQTGSAESLAEVLAEVVPTLRPGPDPDAELAASERSAARRREAGEEFVSIAEHAATMGTG